MTIFWDGLVRLVGKPDASRGLDRAIAREHCDAGDTHEPFEARNYGIVTTSFVEYHFVAAPDKLASLGPALAALGIRDGGWPQGREARRSPMSFEQFKAEGATGMRLDASLWALNEQALSRPEFFVLRSYTGPLYEKYNSSLRAPTAAFMASYARDVLHCGANQYSATIHVLGAAIYRLGKLTQARTVYRAPGRALPASFWSAPHNSVACGGVPGIVEAGCMSCSVDKAQAMHYARRGGSKVLFEVQLGLICRGADINSWGLSQFPAEQEVLMPPVTALQIIRSFVEQDVVVVVLQPTTRDVAGLKRLKVAGVDVATGAEDVERLERSLAAERRRAALGFLRALAARQRAALRQRGAALRATFRDLALRRAVLDGKQAHEALKARELEAAQRARDAAGSGAAREAEEGRVATLQAELDALRRDTSARHVEIAELTAEHEAALAKLQVRVWHARACPPCMHTRVHPLMCMARAGEAAGREGGARGDARNARGGGGRAPHGPGRAAQRQGRAGGEGGGGGQGGQGGPRAGAEGEGRAAEARREAQEGRTALRGRDGGQGGRGDAAEARGGHRRRRGASRQRPRPRRQPGACTLRSTRRPCVCMRCAPSHVHRMLGAPTSASRPS